LAGPNDGRLFVSRDFRSGDALKQRGGGRDDAEGHHDPARGEEVVRHARRDDPAQRGEPGAGEPQQAERPLAVREPGRDAARVQPAIGRLTRITTFASCW